MSYDKQDSEKGGKFDERTTEKCSVISIYGSADFPAEADDLLSSDQCESAA